MVDFKALIDKFPGVFALYFNRKWTRGVVKYPVKTGEAPVDVRTLLEATTTDILNAGKKIAQEHSVMDERALESLRYVMRTILYKPDIQKWGKPEYWQTAPETMHSLSGDCEDGAILLMKVMEAAGIPEFRRKLNAGNVQENPIKKTGHAYVIYLASDLEWYVLDWCFWPIESVAAFQKQPQRLRTAKYKDIWFTWNSEFCWPNQHDTIMKWG